MEKVIAYLIIGVSLAFLLALDALPVIIIVGGLLLGIFIISVTSQPKDRRSLFKIFIAGFLLRLCVSTLFYFLSLARGGDGFFFMDDGIDASYNGWEIAKLWRKNIFLNPEIVESICPSTRLGPYHYWNAFIYYFTGWNPLVMFFINCLVSALTIILIYMIARKLFDRRVAVISSLLYTFWPSIFFWSTMNSKEPLTIFFICLAIFSCINLKCRFSLRQLLIMVLSIFLLNRLRTVVISILLTFTIILSFLFPYKKNINRRLVSSRIILIGTVVFGISIATGFKIFTWGGEFYNLSLVGNTIFEAINYSHNVQTMDAASAFFPAIDISTPLRTLLYLPFGLFIVLFAPFPWRISSSLQLIAAPEMLIWYILLPFILRGSLLSFRDRWRESSVIILFIVIMLLTLALCEGNMGTMFRHRTHMVPLCLILASAGLIFNKKDTLCY